jgi:ABC-2 type transport system permease protein
MRRDCHGSAPRPAEAAAAAQRAALVHGGPVSFLFSTALAILVAIGTFVVLALLRSQSASVDVTPATFTAFAFGWLILPIFAFGLDSTLDPATLAVYPLRIRPLAVGLLAASATGPGRWPM